jgi:ribosomal protein L27
MILIAVFNPATAYADSNSLYLCYASQNGWSGWYKDWNNAPLMKKAAVMNGHMVGIGLDGTLYMCYANSNFSMGWTNWIAGWNNAPKMIDVAVMDGHIVGIGQDHSLYMCYATANGWSSWIKNWNNAPSYCTSVALSTGHIWVTDYYDRLKVSYISNGNWSNFITFDSNKTFYDIAAMDGYILGVDYEENLNLRVAWSNGWSDWMVNWNYQPTGFSSVAAMDGHIFALSRGTLFLSYLNSDYWTGWIEDWNNPPVGFYDIAAGSGHVIGIGVD